MARYGFSIGGVIRIVTGFLLLTCLLASCGQGVAYLDWQRCVGGSQDDYGECIQQTADGGYIAAGYAASRDGDVRGGHAGYDYLIVKFDASHNIEWQKCLGGGDDDMAYSIQQTKDGGYVVAGCTNSAGHTDSDGDVSGKHGYNDYWVVRLDSKGNVKWQKCLGGGKDEKAYSIRETSDGGYIVAGTTNSNSGDVSGNHGGSDYWIVKLNDGGKLIWQKCLGGSDDDVARCVQQTKDGGYIVAGTTNSNNGDVIGNHGGYDFWVVKLYANGSLDWQRCLGGSGDEGAKSIQQTSDGGYILVGDARSKDGDVSGQHGDVDYWLVKLDSNGSLDWQRSLGGGGEDWPNGVQQTADGGYILAGKTNSNDGDVIGNHGDWDCWIVKLGGLNCSIAAPDEVCPGSEGNAASTAESGAAYAWYISNGNITSRNDIPSIVFTAGSSGTVRLTVNVTGGGFWRECSKDISIAAPNCIWTSNSPVDYSNPVRFTGPSGMDSYNWEFGDGLSGTEQNPRHTYIVPGTFNVGLTASKGGCISTCAGQVVVQARPCWSSNSPVCNGTAVVFDGPSGMNSYNWDFGDGSKSQEEDPVHLYSAPGKYSVMLAMKLSGGIRACASQIEVKSCPTIEVATGLSTPNATSELNFSWSSNSNSPVRVGRPVRFDGPSGMDRYLWSFGDESISKSEDPRHIYRRAGTYTVSLTAIKGKVSKRSQGKVVVKSLSDCS